MCNGEIYNWRELKKQFDIEYEGDSDCEIIGHLFNKGKTVSEICRLLDGVFAFVLVADGVVHAARDPIGIRPLFACLLDSIVFASEAKAVLQEATQVVTFPPGTSWSSKNGYEKYDTTLTIKQNILQPESDKIVLLLEEAVKKRLMSEKKIGFLLSGGLDSSLIAAIGAKYLGKIDTFSIGIKGGNSPDIKNAKIVSEHLQSNHTSVFFTEEDGLTSLHSVINALESIDVTTIRASTPMYLLAKYIKENTDIKVILSGEGADELFGGYLYFHNSPSCEEFQEETERLVSSVHHFDVLRADRSTAVHGLEVRVPFFDKAFVNYVLSIPPEFKIPTKDKMEKYLLRNAFASSNLLPESILWRRKDAFSDAVGYKWVDVLKEKANATNISEKVMYKNIYCEIFGNRIPNVPYDWMPKWCDVDDPSATYLKAHGERC
jgi:asparagine synthase (glutamine-hydrolysing)